MSDGFLVGPQANALGVARVCARAHARLTTQAEKRRERVDRRTRENYYFTVCSPILAATRLATSNSSRFVVRSPFPISFLEFRSSRSSIEGVLADPFRSTYQRDGSLLKLHSEIFLPVPAIGRVEQYALLRSP